MRRVQLEETKIYQDEMALVSIFIQAASRQGFGIEWVEAVINQAIADNCSNFRDIMLAHIEIIPDSADWLK